VQISGHSPVGGNSGPFNAPQVNQVHPIAQVAFIILLPVCLAPIIYWGAKKVVELEKYYQERREFDESARTVEAFMNGPESPSPLTLTHVVLIALGTLTFIASCVAYKNWTSVELPANITHLNTSNLNESLSKISKNFLNLPQCYKNQTPVIKISEFLLKNSSSPLNRTLNATTNRTLNATLNFTALLQPKYNLSDIFSSFGQYISNFSFRNTFNFQVSGSFNMSSYWGTKSISTIISEYASGVSQWARNYICESFAIDNC